MVSERGKSTKSNRYFSISTYSHFLQTLELGVYSLQTDVWSYGILAWEIYADGAEPYTGMSNQQARAEILMHAYRMDIPNVSYRAYFSKTSININVNFPSPFQGTPTRVAAMIIKCWDTEPKERPTFTDIVEALTK
jgi:serine/threonine protein kinase